MDFISNMYGPDFLLFYGGVSVAVFLALMLLRLRIKPFSSKMDKGWIDDPYQIALLRGGLNAVLLTALAKLSDKACLLRDETNRNMLVQAMHIPHDAGLSLIEKKVLQLFDKKTARDPKKILEVPADLALLKNACLPLENILEAEGLLIPEQSFKSYNLLVRFAIGLLAALGIYKATIGIMGDKPVMFLLMMLVCVYIIYRICRLKNRKTNLAASYLSDSQIRYQNLIRKTDYDDGEYALALAIYGAAAISMADSDLFGDSDGRRGFAGNASGADTSCGSSCSSSSSDSGGGDSGGSSCGSGCGGCGGGGD